MSFENHIFISYTHDDNQLQPDRELGWVSYFHKTLEGFLKTRKRGVKIWIDNKLDGDDIFGDEINDNIKNTALLVSIVTPNYLHSYWCKKEAADFYQIAESDIGVRAGNKSRIIKVVKFPVEPKEIEESLPGIMSHITGHEFFYYDDNVELELDPGFGEKEQTLFRKKVAKLATELAKRLKDIPSSNTKEQSVQTDGICSRKQTVYLAESSSDLKEVREDLETELQSHKFLILPDHPLSRDPIVYEEEVKEMLARCDLSVHLIGSNYDENPDNANSSITTIQNQLAVEQSKESDLKRIIWLPEKSSRNSRRQKQLINDIKTSSDQQYGADLITGDLEELKSTIHDQLARLALEKNMDREITVANRQIFLICTPEDVPATDQLRSYLKSKGFEVNMPKFDGIAKENRRFNKNSLKRSQAVILHYGAGDENWRLLAQRRLKTEVRLSGRSELPLCICLHGSLTEDKENLIHKGVEDVVDCLQDFTEPKIEEILRVLKLPDEGAEA